MNYPNLLSPIRLGRTELKNRIVYAATVTNLAAGNWVTGAQIRFYEQRAKGGAAMIVTEGLVVHPTSVPLPVIVDLSRAGEDGALHRWAEAVERHGCRLLGQLWHVGRQQLWNPVGSPWGVSDQPDALSWTVPHVMTEAEIGELVDAFVAAAKRLQGAGFSGAELHGAHGYLITQFLSPWSNTREDGYGGDLEGRTRFLREIMAGIRAECGAGFLLGLKMPADEGVPGGIDLEEAKRITRRLAGLGQLDYIAYSQGNFSLSLEHHLPDMHWPVGPFLELHKAIKADRPGVAVMAVGRVTSAEHGERVLAEQGADLIAMSRALIADPALPAKAAGTIPAPVRPCVFCNVCWGEIHAGKPIACFLNPGLGRPDETEPRIDPAPAPRRIVVVGAGLAGLEAAWSAAARGHRVTLLGASAEPGGKARLEARLPGRGDQLRAIDYLTGLIREYRVDYQGSRVVDAEAVLALEPDAVVLATGSTLRAPALEPGSEPMTGLREAAAELMSKVGSRSGTAVLFDQDHTAPVYAAAELLAERFDKAVLITPRVQIARSVPYVSGIGVYRRLYRAGVEIVLAAAPVSRQGGRFTYRNVFTGETGTIDGVTLACYATPRIADGALAEPLRQAGIEVHLVGDCYAPRSPLAAVHEGHRVGSGL